jgi:hypothetical protein
MESVRLRSARIPAGAVYALTQFFRRLNGKSNGQYAPRIDAPPD